MPREIAINFTPLHQGQLGIYHRLGRRSIIRCGRRWGKTTAFEHWAADWALNGMSVGFFAPEYQYLKQPYANIHRTLRPAIESASKNDMLIDLKTGGRLEFMSLMDQDAGRGRAFHRVLIDEASLVTEGLGDIFEKAIAPTLLDYGGSAVMAGTPKGENLANYFYCCATNQGVPERWTEFHAPTENNPILPHEEIERLKANTHPLIFRQEYLAEFVNWSGTAFFNRDSLLVNGQGVDWPQNIDYCFAVIDTAIKDGQEHDGTAVLICGANRWGTGPRLTLLDWDILQVSSDLLPVWLPGVVAETQRYATVCKARHGDRVAIFIEDKGSGTTLLQHSARNGIPAFPIPASLTAAGKDGRAFMCANAVHRGDVRISQHAHNKVVNFKGFERNHLEGQVCSFVIGDKDAHKRSDDLVDCFTYSVIVGLEEGV